MEFLLTHGADVSAKNKTGVAPLGGAVANGFEDIAQTLRSKGAR